MKYQVLARKWRPHNFSEVVGQEHVVQSLVNALRHDRLHHAYLFTGTRGVGKTTLARILAKAINCENREDFNPCGICPVCRELDEGRFLDLIEVDAASRTKVEDTRDLLDNAQYAPNRGRYKVYLIDEVHMLSGHSFNALLKTLEEPPPHVKFLLATTDPQKIPVTVLSRCLQFNLKRLLPKQIFGQMVQIVESEGIVFDQAAIKMLSYAADGSMRDGLSLLDQAIVYGGGEIVLEDVQRMLGTVAKQPLESLIRALAVGDAPKIMALIQDISNFSVDFDHVLAQLLRTLHGIALRQQISAVVEDEEEEINWAELTALLSPEDVQLFYQMALIGRRDLEWAPDPKSGFEMQMLRMLAFRPTDRADTAPSLSRQENIRETGHEPIVPENNQVTVEQAQGQDWAMMVASMKLESLTKQLAVNCMLERVDDHVCQLRLDAKHQSLLNPKRAEKLQNAIQGHFGKPLQLMIHSDKPVTDTPANQEAKKREQHQQAAEEAIESDPRVKALQEQFDATIIPGSIEPL